MHKATCGDCGNECQVPFEPRGDKPVYCNECFQKHKPQGGGGRFGRNDRGGDRGGGYNRGSRDDRPREMLLIQVLFLARGSLLQVDQLLPPVAMPTQLTA